MSTYLKAIALFVIILLPLFPALLWLAVDAAQRVTKLVRKPTDVTTSTG
ncbi:MAG TPA: hypothetical protein VH496_15420 [Mycobacterium sp.]|jgi:hypothetical protein